MRRYYSLRAALLGGFTVLACLVAGCHRQEEVPPSQLASHILRMANLWNAYRIAHNKKIPPSTEELTKWAKSLSPSDRKKYHIEDLDDILISPRDHEPYQVVPHPKMTPMGTSGLVVYEKVGVNGRHAVGGNMGTAGELSDADLKKVLGTN